MKIFTHNTFFTHILGNLSKFHVNSTKIPGAHAFVFAIKATRLFLVINLNKHRNVDWLGRFCSFFSQSTLRLKIDPWLAVFRFPGCVIILKAAYVAVLSFRAWTGIQSYYFSLHFWMPVHARHDEQRLGAFWITDRTVPRKSALPQSVFRCCKTSLPRRIFPRRNGCSSPVMSRANSVLPIIRCCRAYPLNLNSSNQRHILYIKRDL